MNQYSLLRLLITFAILFHSSSIKLFSKDKEGFKPNAKLVNLADNTAINLGKFKWEKPQGEPNSGSVTDYSGMTYDVHNNRILMFGGGHSATYSDAIYCFSFETLNSEFKALYTPTPFQFYSPDNLNQSFWKAGLSEMNYPRPVGRHTYDLLIVPSERKELLMLRNGAASGAAASAGVKSAWGGGGVYDFKTNKWSIIPTKELIIGGWADVAEYDPISKNIFGFSSKGVFVFKTKDRKSYKLKSSGDYSNYHGSAVYSKIDDSMYVMGTPYGKKEIFFSKYKLDRKKLSDSKMVKLKNYPKEKKGYPVFVYDTKNNVLIGGPYNNKFYIYDPVKKTWEANDISGGNPGDLMFWCIAYSPVDNVLIFITKSRSVWAYRYKG
ncbi:MAG: hypothetical protein COA79_18865 [Planctomycetota bacterium]|nr:MAG: hypothetical protein COA79_18865 [Planctomycetota bacterium]